MSQLGVSKAEAAEERSEQTRSFVRTVKAAARRRYTPEEKIRIVLEGFRREVTVNDLCRREGIKPHSYYSWTKEFMEAVLMFSDSVLPNWSAKMSDYGDIDVDSEGAGKTSGAQQLTGRAHDPGPGGNPHGSERTPHQAHPGGL